MMQLILGGGDVRGVGPRQSEGCQENLWLLQIRIFLGTSIVVATTY